MALKDMGLVPLIIDIDDDIIKPLFAKEGDYRSRGILLQILDKGKEIDTTGIIVEFFAKPRDGKVYVVEATPVDTTKGKYEIVYPSSILQPGVVQCEIRLVKMTDDEIEEIITTKTFNLKVYKTIADEDIFEGIDIEPFVEILVQAAINEEERIAAENERIQAENVRKSSENTRELNEQTRIQNENIRQSTEQTRQQNEAIRQQNEQQRIDLYNALKDLDVSQYELRLQKLEHDTSVEETVVEEAYGPVIPLPENVVNGQINEIKIFGNTEAEEDNVKSTFGAIRLKSVNEDETKESTLYILGRDEEGNILELRSLPDGTKDEFNITEGKATIRTKEVVFNGSENWDYIAAYSGENTICFSLIIPDMRTSLGKNLICDKFIPSGAITDIELIYGGIRGSQGAAFIRIARSKLTTQDVAGFKAWLQANPVTLIYQLAEPIEIPIEVFGNLQSYENGTVYIDTIIPKVSFYDSANGIQVTVPIKVIDTLYKVDKETGVLTPLDISQAVIAEDGLSFTHPELADGDLVDWDYVPNLESTNPCISMKLPTNLKASVTSTLEGVQELSNKTKNLNTRVIANRRDIYDLQDNFATLQSDVFGISNELDTHISENSRKHISESGENANGRYVRFDDGTQICWRKVDLGKVSFTEQTVQGVYGGQTLSYAFPANFIQPPDVFTDVESNGYTLSCGDSTGTIPSTSTVRVRIWAPHSISQNYVRVKYKAIGRWKNND